MAIGSSFDLWLPPPGGSRGADGILPPEGGSHRTTNAAASWT